MLKCSVNGVRWINPIQYGFEGLLVNEFYNLELQCVTPYIAPPIPNGQEQYQSCALQGSTPGSLTVSGANYVNVAFGYKRSHLWRNFGIISGMFFFFVFLQCIGFELQKPNKGGGAVTVYKRGQVPKTVEQELDVKKPANDEESGSTEPIAASEKQSDDEGGDSKKVEGIAKNETIFTFQNINLTIPYEKGERKLLQNIQGYDISSNHLYKT